MSSTHKLQTLSSKIETISVNREHEKYQLESLNDRHSLIIKENNELKSLVEDLELQLSKTEREVRSVKSQNTDLEEELKLKSGRMGKIKTNRLAYELKLEEKDMVIAKLRKKFKERDIQAKEFKRQFLDKEDELNEVRVKLRQSRLAQDQLRLTIEKYRNTEQKKKILSRCKYTPERRIGDRIAEDEGSDLDFPGLSADKVAKKLCLDEFRPTVQPSGSKIVSNRLQVEIEKPDGRGGKISYSIPLLHEIGEAQLRTGSL
jgi:hypothetical protein